MVLCAKTPLSKAEEVKQYLAEKSLANHSYSAGRDKDSISFPIIKKGSLKRKFPFVEFVEIDCKQRQEKKKNFRESITSTLTKDELDHLRRAFDIIGSIAILEIPPELEKKEKLLADTLLAVQNNVKTVLKKAGTHGTEFRTQPMAYLAGINTKETIHIEHGVRLNLDVEKVYFSPRLSTERKRIADQIRPGESILVMFSGCAPYPCVIARNTRAEDITGIEINPEGHRYGLENIKLNRITNVQLINGDVKKVVPSLNRKFDRIVMPLPKSAGDFLDTALGAAKKGTIIHFYAFEEEGRFDAAVKRVFDACRKAGVDCETTAIVKCGQHAPRVFRICVDFRVI
jgi:tRNA (guanine37-N1)-methyltransferase